MFSIHQASTRSVTQYKGSGIFYIASPRKQLRLDQRPLRDVEETSESRTAHQELGVTQEMLKISQKQYEVAQHDQHYEQSQMSLGSLQSKELISQTRRSKRMIENLVRQDGEDYASTYFNMTSIVTSLA